MLNQSIYQEHSVINPLHCSHSTRPDNS